METATQLVGEDIQPQGSVFSKKNKEWFKYDDRYLRATSRICELSYRM